MNRLAGKVALITGGARGQGAAHGRLFAEEGARVVLGDVRDELGERQSEELQADGFEVVYTHLDVTRSDDWDRAVGFVEERFGALHILINNAGISPVPGIVEETEAGWQRVMAVNALGVWLGMKHTIPALRRSGGGAIVNVSSIWGVAGVEGYAGYQASKGAVIMLTKAAALEYVAEGIRVNAVLPGLIATPMLDEVPQESNEATEAATPMKRAGEPREVSYGVLFLASDEASYVTGTELAIDGGYLAQ